MAFTDETEPCYFLKIGIFASSSFPTDTSSSHFVCLFTYLFIYFSSKVFLFCSLDFREPLHIALSSFHHLQETPLNAPRLLCPF